MPAIRTPAKVLMEWMDEHEAKLTGATPAMLVSALDSAGMIRDPNAPTVERDFVTPAVPNYDRRVQAVTDAAAVLYSHAPAEDLPAVWDITRLADYLATGQVTD